MESQGLALLIIASSLFAISFPIIFMVIRFKSNQILLTQNTDIVNDLNLEIKAMTTSHNVSLFKPIDECQCNVSLDVKKLSQLDDGFSKDLAKLDFINKYT